MNYAEALLVLVVGLAAFALGFTHGVLSEHIDATHRGRGPMSRDMHGPIDETGLNRRR